MKIISAIFCCRLH